MVCIQIFQRVLRSNVGGVPRVVVSTAAFHEFGVRFPVSAVKETKYVSSPSTC